MTESLIRRKSGQYTKARSRKPLTAKADVAPFYEQIFLYFLFYEERFIKEVF